MHPLKIMAKRVSHISVFSMLYFLTVMQPNLQPTLSNETLVLQPLQPSNFKALYAVAADPKIWEQHPNWDRYKEEVFKEYFDGAIASNGAFLIVHKATQEVMGCTRFYEYNAAENSVGVGFTFLATKFWGGVYNKQIKTLMFNYAFTFVDTVILHIGANNIRSQKGNERIGAKLVNVVNFNSQGKALPHHVYAVTKANWLLQGK
jgi:N-acetyltransferase